MDRRPSLPPIEPTNRNHKARKDIPPRFKEVRVSEQPGPGEYCLPTFLDKLDSKVTSRRELLRSLDCKSYIDKPQDGPGPGSNDVNYAIGRHVANDYKFALLKSAKLMERDKKNKNELSELREVMGKNDIFTDKRACRRMAHFALKI